MISRRNFNAFITHISHEQAKQLARLIDQRAVAWLN